MENKAMDSKWFLAIVFSLLAICHVCLGLAPIRDFSPTYDEPVHLTAGYICWTTGDYRYNGFHHSPFGEMWAALPLLFLKPILPTQNAIWVAQRWTPADQYQFADVFLFHNRVPAERMMELGRMMQLALSCALGALITLTAFYIDGLSCAAFAALFWGFSPAFLTNGTIVSTDLAFALFFFGFFASFLHRDHLWAVGLGGVSLGLCLASKYFALAVFPSVIAVLAWEYVISKAPKSAFRNSAKSSFIIALAAIVTLGAVYRFSNLDMFWLGFKELIGRSQAGRSSFFWGNHGTQGWFLYFPFVFFVKTPLPLTISLLTSCIGAWKKRVHFSPELWIPPLVFFAIACLSKVQIGHRHLLAVYPFYCVIGSAGLASFPMVKKWLAGPLVLWLVIGTWNVRPHFIAYFNELVGGPSQGYKYLTDSNLDWGQGLKLLSQELSQRDRTNGIYLSYFGVVDPHIYGIRYLDVGSDRIVPRTDDTAQGLKPAAFAISITNLQCTYYVNKSAFDWLKTRRPVKQIAHSIFLYDFSNDLEALIKLERLRS